jgi:hypothetical protein
LREPLAPTSERSDAVLRTVAATTAMQALGGVLRSRGIGQPQQGKGTCYAKSDDVDRALSRSISRAGDGSGDERPIEAARSARHHSLDKLKPASSNCHSGAMCKPFQRLDANTSCGGCVGFLQRWTRKAKLLLLLIARDGPPTHVPVHREALNLIRFLSGMPRLAKRATLERGEWK